MKTKMMLFFLTAYILLSTTNSMSVKSGLLQLLRYGKQIDLKFKCCAKIECFPQDVFLLEMTAGKINCKCFKAWSIHT